LGIGKYLRYFSEEDIRMTVKDVKKKAKEMGIKSTKVLKADLIRAIQAREGNSPCYKTGVVACDQSGCCWFGDCQKD
jgi:hypothetical protein